MYDFELVVYVTLTFVAIFFFSLIVDTVIPCAVFKKDVIFLNIKIFKIDIRGALLDIGERLNFLFSKHIFFLVLRRFEFVFRPYVSKILSITLNLDFGWKLVFYSFYCVIFIYGL